MVCLRKCFVVASDSNGDNKQKCQLLLDVSVVLCNVFDGWKCKMDDSVEVNSFMNEWRLDKIAQCLWLNRRAPTTPSSYEVLT